MNKNDFVHVLADVMQKHEGFGIYDNGVWTETASIRNNNPGNLKFANQSGATKSATSAFAVFDTFRDGKQAQLNQLNLDLTRYDTLSKLISKYAPPTENNTEAYITCVVNGLSARNIKIGANDSIDAFIKSCNQPTVLIVINNLVDMASWNTIQSSLDLLASFMPGYIPTVRYAAADLSGDITTVQNTNPAGTYSGISAAAAQNILSAYNQGQVLNILVYDGAIMQGHPTPYGGCEFSGAAITQDPYSTVATAMFQGPMFYEDLARVIFHELIHSLFGITRQNDTLHAYLITHSGYAANALADLTAVYDGNNLNTPQAILALLEDELDLMKKVANS